MNRKTDLAAAFPPMKIEKVDKILLYDFDAIKIEKEDERVQFILRDPYCPNKKIIQGVYVIYKKSIMELLEGKIGSIHSVEFMDTKKKDRTISEEDIEYVLEMATVVVLASEHNEVLTKYFYSGTGARLDNILSICSGYSPDLVGLKSFMKDIKIVGQMGLLEKVIGNKSKLFLNDEIE